MTPKQKLLRAVKTGKASGSGVESLGYDFDMSDGFAYTNPESFLLYAMQEGEVFIEGKSLEFIERVEPKRDYYDDSIHGQPMKFVFKVDDTVFVAIGEYDSWDGESFSNGFSEAELVDVPTWLPKRY